MSVTTVSVSSGIPLDKWEFPTLPRCAVNRIGDQRYCLFLFGNWRIACVENSADYGIFVALLENMQTIATKLRCQVDVIADTVGIPDVLFAQKCVTKARTVSWGL
jgi:hypothetical protein